MSVWLWALIGIVALYLLLPPVLWIVRRWSEGAGKEAQETVGAYTFAINGDGLVVNPDADHQVMSPSAIREQLNLIVTELDAPAPAREPKRILVYVHGGLQPLHGSRESARSRYPRIARDGYRPLFVNWESGPLATYWEHLFLIRSGRKRRKLALASYPFVFLGDLLRGVANAPNSLVRRLYNYIRRPSDDAVNALHDGLVKHFVAGNGAAIETSIGEDSRVRKAQSGKSLGWLIPRAISVVTGAFVEGPGTAAWQNMQRRTKTTFRRPQEFDLAERARAWGGQLPVVVDAALDSPASGGLSLLVEQLCDLTSNDVAGASGTGHEREPNPEYEITLVGHSMGAIVANEVLRQHPHLPIKNIVYMGAACSIGDCFESVLEFIDGQLEADRATFYNLCLHPEAERRERNAVDLVPRGSLLEWIDDMFESPRAFVDRRAGKWENVLQATHMIPERLRGHVKIKAFGVGTGAKSDPQKHGEFDNKRFWEQSYWEPVREQPVPPPASASPGSTAAGGVPSGPPPTTLPPVAAALDEAVSLDVSMPQSEAGSPNGAVPQEEERADVSQPH
jgi:hypothetical protein